MTLPLSKGRVKKVNHPAIAVHMLLNNIGDDKDEKHEKYFTRTHIAVDAIKVILEDLKLHFNFPVSSNNRSNYHFIEPSCGTGEFVKALRQNLDNVKLSYIDIDEIYQNSILGDFLKTDRKDLDIQDRETVIFFGCPPSYLTTEFVEHCKRLEKSSIVYFLICENKLISHQKGIQDWSFVSTLKNYGYHVFFFKGVQSKSVSPYFLSRITFI